MSPTSRSQDRDWLGYDHAATDAPQAQADGAAASPDPSVESPWLRHDLAGESTSGDPTAGAGTGGATEVPGRDPAWLAPELEVSSDPAAVDPAEDPHDTGVPPTLAEEPPTVQPSQSAGGAAYEEPAHAAYDEPAHAAYDEPAHAADGDSAPTGPDDTPLLTPDERDEETSPRPGRDGDDGEEEAGLLAVMGAAVKEFAIVVGMALVLSFIVKTWLLQAFYIPSGSMENTLVLNDRVIVSKLTPGPVDLKRGDIIVFADPGEWLEETPQVPHGKLVTAVRETATFVGLLPDNSENHLIKRVIGLPGDHVKCCDEGGRITVNGVGIKEPYLKPGDAASEQDFDITVPRGRVWVMGDHRSNSADSRAHDAPDNDGTQGSVDERLIVGRAVALVWPLDHLTWLSNPTATFAKVPAPASEEGTPPAEEPSGGSGSQTGGAEVTGDGEGGG